MTQEHDSTTPQSPVPAPSTSTTAGGPAPEGVVPAAATPPAAAAEGAPLVAPGPPAERVRRGPPPPPKAKSYPDPAMEALVNDVYSSFTPEISYAVDEVCVLIPRDQALKACELAKNDSRLQMDYLRCLAVTEFPTNFQVSVLVYSTALKHKLIIKMNAPKDDAVVPSVTAVWGGANWHEREGAELFGVKFAGHPDPRYLLLFEEFDGKYPLRKDYPYEEITEWSPESAAAWQEHA